MDGAAFLAQGRLAAAKGAASDEWQVASAE
jgi:hypothetical protein